MRRGRSTSYLNETNHEATIKLVGDPVTLLSGSMSSLFASLDFVPMVRPDGQNMCSFDRGQRFRIGYTFVEFPYAILLMDLASDIARLVRESLGRNHQA